MTHSGERALRSGRLRRPSLRLLGALGPGDEMVDGFGNPDRSAEDDFEIGVFCGSDLFFVFIFGRLRLCFWFYLYRSMAGVLRGHRWAWRLWRPRDRLIFGGFGRFFCDDFEVFWLDSRDFADILIYFWFFF